MKTGITKDRETGLPFFRVMTKNGQVVIDKDLVSQMMGAEKIVRVTRDEYPEDVPRGTLIYHFGLPIDADFVGTTVSLARIIEFGYFRKDGDERIPLLSFANVWQAVVKQRIAATTYDKLSEKFFRNSIGGATDIASVKKLILARYRNSLPDMTDEEILAHGVSVRLFRLLKRVSFPYSV